MKALRPEIPESQPQQFPILPPSRGHTLHTSKPVSDLEAHGLLSYSGTSARVIERVTAQLDSGERARVGPRGSAIPEDHTWLPKLRACSTRYAAEALRLPGGRRVTAATNRGARWAGTAAKHVGRSATYQESKPSKPAVCKGGKEGDE